MSESLTIIARQRDGLFCALKAADLDPDDDPIAGFSGKIDILLSADAFSDLPRLSAIPMEAECVTMVCAYTERSGIDTVVINAPAGDDLHAFALATFRHRCRVVTETINFVCLARGVLPDRLSAQDIPDLIHALA